MLLVFAEVIIHISYVLSIKFAAKSINLVFERILFTGVNKLVMLRFPGWLRGCVSTDSY
jgi:hypothetical protein